MNMKTLPGLTPELARELEAALQAKGPAYRARTRHLETDGSPRFVNRLILSTSPYLLQHAHNPVSWFPWGSEAFELARALGRPVFLSVGYSTCHWCHVMEEESFEDLEIARHLNDHYIAVKVDREERPDVDSVYMSAVQALTGQGGWPMSVWLTPERQPFFGGTYFPPRDGARGARFGFLSILRELAETYESSPERIASHAAELSEAVRRSHASAAPGGVAGAEALDLAAQQASRTYDPTWGGQGGEHARTPKFPSAFPVRALLRQHLRTGAPEARTMAAHTLQMMSRGGIADHVGGGFHRYSTDQRWLVPHFEKMLYDQALLVPAYLEGYQVTGDADFARVARETLDYVARELLSREGLFYSATDADSLGPKGEREEGYYFTWTPAELDAALGPERRRVLCAYYGVTEGGNFEASSRTILHTPRSRREAASALGVTQADMDATLAASLPLLRAEREKRAQPLLDDKVQTSWNGLMLAAFARGARVLARPDYARLAERAAAALLRVHRKDGRLRHSSKDGRVSDVVFADDYAFLAAGLLELFEATSTPRWLAEAISLMDELARFHEDEENGGYFLTPFDGEPLLAREKPSHDGALPSANSVALLTELRLALYTTDRRWRERAEGTCRAFAARLERLPITLDVMLLGVDLALSEPRELVLVVPPGEHAAAECFLDVLRRSFAPHYGLVVGSEDELAGELGRLVPWARGKRLEAGCATAYVCREGACELPTRDPEVMARQLGVLVSR